MNKLTKWLYIAAFAVIVAAGSLIGVPARPVSSVPTTALGTRLGAPRALHRPTGVLEPEAAEVPHPDDLGVRDLLRPGSDRSVPVVLHATYSASAPRASPLKKST